jgi:hypothetical protein
MNLKLFGGKVPIYTGTTVELVDFPSKKIFDGLFERSPPENRDKYWVILKARSKGHSLEESGRPYAYSRERVRQIEAKFLRGMTKAFSLATDSL